MAEEKGGGWRGEERRGQEKENRLFDLLDGGFCEVRDSGQVGGFDCEVECDVDVSLDDVMVGTDEGSWDGHLWICYGGCWLYS